MKRPLDTEQLKLKSASLHFEFMFTRSMFTPPDISRRGEILQQTATLPDEGKITTFLSKTLHGLMCGKSARSPSSGAGRRYARKGGHHLLISADAGKAQAPSISFTSSTQRKKR